MKSRFKDIVLFISLSLKGGADSRRRFRAFSRLTLTCLIQEIAQHVSVLLARDANL
jgi:hypothetical protein